MSVPEWETAKETLLKEFLSHERIGVITDMDGVLAPVVRVFTDATVTEKNRELLAKLHGQVALVAVISGRAVADIIDRVKLPQLTYSGNHGMERRIDGETKIIPEVEAYLPGLQAAKGLIQRWQPEGMAVEDKGASITVHYRNTSDPDAIEEEYEPIMKRIAKQNKLQVYQGRKLFELRPPLDINKGTAFKQLVEEFKLDAAIYLGDDTTDVDAFSMAQTLREAGDAFCMGAGVVDDDTLPIVRETADVLISGVTGVESFLEWLSDALNTK